MYLIVETLKKTYICESTAQEGTRTILNSAVELSSEEKDDANATAKAYVRAHIAGKVKKVSVSEKNLESSEDAEEESPLIELMLKYVPIAEKNARVNAILAEIDTLMGEGEEFDE